MAIATSGADTQRVSYRLLVLASRWAPAAYSKSWMSREASSAAVPARWQQQSGTDARAAEAFGKRSLSISLSLSLSPSYSLCLEPLLPGVCDQTLLALLQSRETQI